jgi:DNA polymerase I
MMLTGLPIDSHRAQEVDLIFEAKAKTLWEQIQLNPHVISFTEVLRIDECMKANSKLRTKVKPIEDFHHVVFNPGSGPQLIKLLFERLALPVLDTTKTGLPTTGNDTLSDLSNHTTDEDTLELLVQIQELADVLKIKNTFIKPFLREPDWVHGNLKLGGTQSGRLSSNDPNLTNLPAHGKMGKIVKSCVKAPKGYLLAGADFSALEERIGAILSQDPQRIKVYTDGYDGHSMRAQKYFGDQMPDIVKALQKAETATEFWIDDEGEYQCE